MVILTKPGTGDPCSRSIQPDTLAKRRVIGNFVVYRGSTHSEHDRIRGRCILAGIVSRIACCNEDRDPVLVGCGCERVIDCLRARAT